MQKKLNETMDNDYLIMRPRPITFFFFEDVEKKSGTKEPQTPHP